MTILNKKIAEREHLELHQTNIPRLHTVTGQRMHVNGKIDLKLMLAWQKGRIEVLVSSDLDDDMLWGDKTSKRIHLNTAGISQHNFKQQRRILLQHHHQVIIRRIYNRIRQILNDELNPLLMKGDPMRISLKPNAIPKKVTGARRVPLRYEEGADSVVQDLMNKKFIVPVNITTDW